MNKLFSIYVFKTWESVYENGYSYTINENEQIFHDIVKLKETILNLSNCIEYEVYEGTLQKIELW